MIDAEAFFVFNGYSFARSLYTMAALQFRV